MQMAQHVELLSADMLGRADPLCCPLLLLGPGAVGAFVLPLGAAIC